MRSLAIISSSSHMSANSCACLQRTFPTVQLIEATTIELRGVTAGTVNGQDVRTGPYCGIGNLDCNGTLYVDPKAEVKISLELYSGIRNEH